MNRSIVIPFFVTMLSLNSQLSYADNLKVAVAANFKQTIEALKTEFEKDTTHTIQVISASTGQLVQQISHGAPFDIFLAANIAHPQILWQQIHEQRGLDKGALQVYANGRLVFFSNHPLTQNKTLAEILSADTYSRLSVANPTLAPYGLAAKQTLECYNIANNWKHKLVTGQNIAQTYQFIHSQSVNAGFVAQSQVLDQPPEQVRVVSSKCYDPIKQMALRLNNKPASQAFMTYLTQPKAKTIIENHGYDAP
ncbi:MAG: molybdate ABC transporter substrate-binding protein [Gammaproteobacteria bacterium]|nr:molybdate ABC transporter substrate-binding protein [Gammaproteobacteria bacterium]